MILLLDCTIKVTMILGITLLVLKLFTKWSAATRHWILVSATLCVAIIPIATWVLPPWSVIPVIETGALQAVPPGEAPASAAPVPLLPGAAEIPAIPQRLPELIWLIGFSIACIALVTGSVRVARLGHFSRLVVNGPWARFTETMSRQHGVRRRIRLLQSRNASILVTWGVLRPKILLPAGSNDWPEDRIQSVLCHELAHIRRGDWLIQMTAQIVRTVYWFNPLVWILCKRLRLESEYACDDAVLAQGISASSYARHLLDVVRLLQQNDTPWSAALAMARPSTIERRFEALVNPEVDHRPATRRIMVAIAIAALSVTLPLAGLSSSTPAPQNVSRQITGSVLDGIGQKVAGATIVVSSPEGRTQGTAMTKDDGAFVLAGLPAGSYVLQVFATGFGPSRLINVELPPSRNVNVDVSMDIGFVEKTEASLPANAEYTGEIVSIDVKDMDIKQFFGFIQAVSGLKVEVDPAVNGVITVHLKDVPWDQMLDDVLKSYQLRHEIQGGVIRMTRSVPPGQVMIVPETQQARNPGTGGQQTPCDGPNDLRTFSQNNGGLSLRVVTRYFLIAVQRSFGKCS